MDKDTLIIITGVTLGLLVGLPLRHYLTKQAKQNLKISNKIGTFIGEKKYKEAIEFAKSQSKLDEVGKMNTGAAYYFLGDKEKAKSLINSVKLPLLASSNLKKALKDWKLKVNS